MFSLCDDEDLEVEFDSGAGNQMENGREKGMFVLRLGRILGMLAVAVMARTSPSPVVWREYDFRRTREARSRGLCCPGRGREGR